MEIELRQIEDDHLISRLEVTGLSEVPFPGRWIHHAGDSYLVLQRRHRYRLRLGRYELVAVALQFPILQRYPVAAYIHLLHDTRPQILLKLPRQRRLKLSSEVLGSDERTLQC